MERFPTLFPEVPPCGVGHGDGWTDLIDTLCCTLTEWGDDDEKNGIRVAQIKEKFGGLRFYVDGIPSEWQRGVIALAESMSFKICEECGKPGVKRDTDWIKTLCDDCYVKVEDKQWRHNAKFRIASLERRLKKLEEANA